MVTKEMICAAHDICLKKGDFVLSASLLERIYLAMRDKEESQLIQTIAKLTAERDALKQQRDDLLAALEQFAIWGRMQHKAQSKGCHATFDMMSLKDEIDLAEAAIASVKEG